MPPVPRPASSTDALATDPMICVSAAGLRAGLATPAGCPPMSDVAGTSATRATADASWTSAGACCRSMPRELRRSPNSEGPAGNAEEGASDARKARASSCTSSTSDSEGTERSVI
jgi:hypothetical protein